MRLIYVVLLVVPGLIWGQQLPDTSFVAPENTPAYDKNQGLTVYIDGGHSNFHTADNRFAPFAKLLARDGYRIEAGDGVINTKLLDQIDLLVISNALHPKNQAAWAVPILPAFTNQEISEIENWVKSGGKLLLIADHMPFPGAVANMAHLFGFTFNNGFAMTKQKQWPPAVFTRTDNTLSDHVITTDHRFGPAVARVATFTGQGFQIPPEATSLLQFDARFHTLMPDTAWQFHDHTPSLNLNGWSQGAVREFHQGRVAVFGEAAMFTAQIAGPQQRKIGFNSPDAPHNAQFVLNVIHWLDGIITN